MRKPLFPFPLLLLGLAAVFPLVPQEEGAAGFPYIKALNNGDPAFKQYQNDVAAGRQRLFSSRSGQEAEEAGAELVNELVIYTYAPQEGDELLALAARCTIPSETIATLNHLAHPGSLENAGTLLLPSMPGLFIPEHPGSDLDMLLDANWEGGFPITVRRNGGQERFRFIPGGQLSPTERTFFLVSGFRFPLKTYRLTSAFGPRVNPVTGRARFHQGLDLAAPLGTEVYAVKEGTVAETGEDSIYGKYIILRHGDNWASLYGHLSSINTVLRSRVQSGTIIGKVGSTGQSTGPHLHFELRQHGKAQDPGKYLFR